MSSGAGSSAVAWGLQRTPRGSEVLPTLPDTQSLSLEQEKRKRDVLERGDTALKEGLSFVWTQYLPQRIFFSLERMEVIKEKMCILSSG